MSKGEYFFSSSNPSLGGYKSRFESGINIFGSIIIRPNPGGAFLWNPY
jgi:hypothetical protein